MPKLNGKTPKYRKHKHSGQAIVTLNGNDHYLGPHGSPESIALYDKLIAEWLSNGRQLLHQLPASVGSNTLTVNALILKFWEFAKTYYRHSDGAQTGELINFRYALRPLRRLYGSIAAMDFGPQALETLRQHMIELGWTRKNINRQAQRVCYIFRWAASKELLPESVYHRLKTLAPLKRGRTNARETPKVKPVLQHLVTAVRPFLSRQVWSMIQLQILAGLRPEDDRGRLRNQHCQAV